MYRSGSIQQMLLIEKRPMAKNGIAEPMLVKRLPPFHITDAVRDVRCVTSTELGRAVGLKVMEDSAL